MEISLDQACHLLREGKVIAIPTDTVYGLAALLSQPEAIEHIFELKGRTRENPLIIQVAERSEVEILADKLPKSFYELAKLYWPGPLTLVVSAHVERVPDSVRAGGTTVGFRIPNHPTALELLKNMGPLVVTSANLSGKASSTNPEQVEACFGKEFPILTSKKRATLGIESTILMYQNGRWNLIRKGALKCQL